MARYRNVTGVDAIQRQFDRMSQRAAERVAQALNLSAHEVEQRAKLLAPVAKGRRSRASLQYGPLRKSIRASIGETNGKVVASVTTGDAFYARFVEFGRAARVAGTVYYDKTGRRRKSRGSSFSRPRPFFWPAYRSVRKKIKRRVRAALNKAAREAVANG